MKLQSEKITPILLIVIIAMLFIILAVLINNKPKIHTSNENDNEQTHYSAIQHAIPQNDSQNQSLAFDVFSDTKTPSTASVVVIESEQLEYLASLIQTSIKNEFAIMELPGSTKQEPEQPIVYFDDVQIQNSNDSLHAIEAEIAGLSDASSFDDFNRIRQLKMQLTPVDYQRFINQAGELFMSKQISGEQFGKLMH